MMELDDLDVDLIGAEEAPAGPQPPSIHLNETRRFLELLAPGQLVTFQTFDDGPSPKRRDLARCKHGTLEQCEDWLRRMNLQGAGVFVTVNATDGKGRKVANVERVRALFVDIDNPVPGTLERLLGDVLPPSIIVASSAGKLHAYWLTDYVEVADFQELQSRVIAEWGGDPACKDLPRVLRLPGFLHLKTPANPQYVRIIEASGHKYGRELIDRYSPGEEEDASDLLAMLPARGSNIANALVELCDGEDVHANALAVVGHLTHYGVPDSTIRGLFEHALVPAVAGARSHDRAAELLGGELERMITGAKVKGFSPLRPGGPALEWVELDDLMTAEIPSVRFIFEPLIPRGEVTHLSADGGTGKSVLALEWAAHVACGKEWAGLPTEQGRVLFVSLEDPADVCRMRLRDVIRKCGLDAKAVGMNVRIADGTKGMGALMALRDGVLHPTEVLVELHAELQREPFDLIVIDNASDAFAGNENDRQEVRTFIRLMRRIARDADAAVLVLAHVDKATVRGGKSAAGSRYSGSTAWNNSVRSRLALFEDGGSLALVQEKLNLGKRLDREIRLTFHDGVPVPIELIEGYSESVEAEEQRQAETVLALMRVAIDAGETIPAADSGPHTARHMLMRLAEAPKDWSTKSGKSRFDAALMRLKREGRMRVEEYQKPNRHVGKRLVLMDALSVGDLEALI